MPVDWLLINLTLLVWDFIPASGMNNLAVIHVLDILVAWCDLVSISVSQPTCLGLLWESSLRVV